MQEPRQMYGLGSLVKKAIRGVKKIVKSPLGKAALLGLGAYGLGGGFGAGFSKENNLALRDLRIDDVSDADREADEELFAGDGDELLPDPGLEFEPAVFVC